MFDVVVVGGGHAGCEAANAASILGAKVAIITYSKNNIGQLSCNPSIGGIGKSHLVKEIDVMGGLMAKVCDESSIHSNILNTKKGYAVRAPRFQIDRELYSKNMLSTILSLRNVSIIEGEVVELIVSNVRGSISTNGVILRSGERIVCSSVIICAGTFLDGKIYYGKKSFSSGRKGEKASEFFSKNLLSFGFKIQKLRTSTPPRVLCDTVDWSVTEEQKPMSPKANMSVFSELNSSVPQINCYISKTNSKSHEIVKNNLEESALKVFSLNSIPPRYCVSIERKIMNFSEKPSHTLFLEPEGLNSKKVYINGLSNGLPKCIQEKMVRSIDCFKNAIVCDYGYVIEYSSFNTNSINRRLETKLVKNLFFAGQINGTTGYEEAAAQGLLAGINSVLAEEKRVSFSRTNSYIGTMVDDLNYCDINEPYRMFTSRSEFRLLLRIDNADIRLADKAREIGTINNEKYNKLVSFKEENDELIRRLKAIRIKYREKEIDGFSYLSYTDDFDTLLSLNSSVLSGFSKRSIDFCSAEAKYEPYLNRAKKQAKDLEMWYSMKIPKDINYKEIKSLSNEAREKLESCSPEDIASARKIQGITPAAISFIVAKIKKKQNQET